VGEMEAVLRNEPKAAGGVEAVLRNEIKEADAGCRAFCETNPARRWAG
jgi:hypothetical protein